MRVALGTLNLSPKDTAAIISFFFNLFSLKNNYTDVCDGDFDDFSDADSYG